MRVVPVRERHEETRVGDPLHFRENPFRADRSLAAATAPASRMNRCLGPRWRGFSCLSDVRHPPPPCSRAHTNPLELLCRSRTGFGKKLLSAQVVQPLLDEPTDLFIWSEEQGTLVALQGLIAAAKPAKHIGSREVERRVLVQCTGTLDILQQSKALDWA